MNVATITPQQAQALITQGALLLDIRNADEYAHEHIAQATSLPLPEIEAGSKPQALSAQNVVIFHCQSGHRTAQNAALLARSATPAKVYLLEGGINGWKQQGLDVVRDKGQPFPIMRQVQIAAGSLILVGAILGFASSHLFFLLPAFVGAGLIFAGISGFCGMAMLLAKMPWNRRR